MSTADLHVHTVYSDGHETPRETVDRAIRVGLDAVAITDHDNMRGVREAQEYAEKMRPSLSAMERDFLVIPGVEVTTKQGHVLGLFVDRVPLMDMDYKYTIRQIHDMGGVAIAAHPFSKNPKGVGRGLFTNLKLFDGVEIMNGSPFMLRDNMKAVMYWMENMGAFAGVGGSDTHFINQVGSVRTNYEGDLKKAILGRTTGIRLSPKDIVGG